MTKICRILEALTINKFLNYIYSKYDLTIFNINHNNIQQGGESQY